MRSKRRSGQDGIQRSQAKMPQPLLEIEDLVKRFGSIVAVDHMSLAIEAREFFTIIGPSGSGKTTLLRLIGGFETPDSYRLFRLESTDLGRLPPNRRNLATVFQDYALFPHMSVVQNVEYGLKVRRIDRATRRERALKALAQVQLPDLGARGIATLSGGQRQRVALARALVTEPAILLLDEPLGALDEKLRADMQFELKHLQQTVGTAFVYVTHNQDEALTMSDRLAVLNEGRVEQLGTPREIYERPEKKFVAEFMGATNLLQGSLIGIVGPDRARVKIGASIVEGTFQGPRRPSNGAVWLSVRPEHVAAVSPSTSPSHDGMGRNALRGRPVKRAYRGVFVETTFALEGGGSLIVRDVEPGAGRDVGEAAELQFDPGLSVILGE